MTQQPATVDRTNDMSYDDALAVFIGADASYSGGLSNHGPMAAEALVSLGQADWMGRFVSHYRGRLEAPSVEISPAPADWRPWLDAQLPELVPHAANLLGHGLLRVAHAVRGIERVETTGIASATQLQELAIAVDYWRSGGTGIAGPARLSGSESIGDWLRSLELLPAFEAPGGSLNVTLVRAAAMPSFVERMSALAPAADPATTLDALSAAAASACARNVGLNAFTLLHGATVSSMARVLLGHLDEDGARALESSVVGFVAAAVVGFDEQAAAEAGEMSAAGEVLDAAQLAADAAATLDEHTIKFADACIGVASRIGDDAPLAALRQQLQTPYGV